MNETFNFKRFWLVLKEELALSSRPLIVNTLATLMLVGVTLYSLYNFTLSTTTGFNVLLAITSILGVLFLSSRMYSVIRSKTAFASYYTKPASTLEKYLSRLLLSNILPVVIWLLLFALLRCSDQYNYRYIIFSNHAAEVISYCVVAVASMFFFWGVVCRTRFGFFMSVIVITLCIIGIALYMAYCNLMFMDPIVRFIVSDPGFGHLDIVLVTLTAVICLANYVAAYYIFRSRQMNLKLFKW